MAALESPLVPPLAALLALQSEAAACAAHQPLVEAAARLTGRETAALQEFRASGLRCLDQLGDAAQRAMKAALQGEQESRNSLPDEKACRSGTQSLVGEKSVRQMFRHFDINGDGMLTHDEFQDMLVSLGLTDHFTDPEISSLLKVADTNGDGTVDLNEFAQWLYGGGLESTAEMTDAKPEPSGDTHLRRQLAQTKSALELADAQLTKANRAHELALKRAEERFEEDLEGSLDFWRAVAQSSATPKLGKNVNLTAATLLGNGKYGYVLKSKRRSDDVVIVVKLLSLRWAHVAAKEWGQARAVADHPNIVEYADVLLHSDEDTSILKILQRAQDEGRLQTRTRRDNFPRHYVCLMQEFMNAGSVQDWMDRDQLVPGGLLVVMQCVASALAHMHQTGITHNDIKPENILLSQANETDPRSEVTVKLADLGLAAKSKDRSDDFRQYGMTVHCMATGAKFGERKFDAGSVDEYVEEVASGLNDADHLHLGDQKDVFAAMTELPSLLRKIWTEEMTMREVSECKTLQGWDFFDGEAPEPSSPISPRRTHRKLSRRHASSEQILAIHALSEERTTNRLGGAANED